MSKTCYLESIELRQSALNWLITPEPTTKASGVIGLQKAFLNGEVSLDVGIRLAENSTIPGRPAQPKLVPPKDLEKRSMRTADGRAALIHALAHIEFNAINLALDAIWRFEDMPKTYYENWLKVAAEEAYHFSLLNAHLQTMGFAYGSFNAHNSLWEMVERTKNDVLARMALVPRTLEARGLDAAPQLRKKLAQAGEAEAAEILDIILRDEIGHVAIGNFWFNWLCKERNLEPISTFENLCKQYSAPKLKPPFNMKARRLAGFSEAELAQLG